MTRSFLLVGIALIDVTEMMVWGGVCVYVKVILSIALRTFTARNNTQQNIMAAFLARSSHA